MVILILAIVFISIASLVIIPIIFSVEKSNNKVISLFGLIPQNEIKYICEQCNSYYENYIEESKGNEYMYTQENESKQI